jgi:peptide/nickel transport system substrate-binding protein
MGDGMKDELSLIDAFLDRKIDRRQFLAGASAIGMATPLIASLTGVAAPRQAQAAPIRQGNPGGSMVFGAWQTPDTMDPQKSGLAATGRILANVFDPLVWRFPGDDTVYPGLASSWEVSSDGLQYTFHLRTDVTFHNGEVFDANAVKYTFDRLNDPAEATLATVPRGFNRVDVPDPATAVIVFDTPYAPFLTLLGAGNWRVLPPQYAASNPEGMGLTPPGTGPFKISEYVPNSHVTLDRYDAYNWAPEAYFGRQGPAMLERIDWRIIAEASTRSSTLESGEVDLIEEIVPAQYEELASNSALTMYQQGTLGCPRSVQLNCTRAPTDDPLVRQAMNYAVDKRVITDVIFRKTVPAAYGPLEPLTPGYNPAVESYYPHDVDKANALLDQAGWVKDGDTRTKDGKVLEALFIVQANNNFDEAAQVLQSQFADVGIKLNLTSESNPTIFNTYNRGDQNLGDIFWWGADPESLYSLYHSSQITAGFNWSHYTNPQLDQLLEQGYVETNVDARMALYQQAQLMIMDDAVLIPLWGKMQLMAGKTNVTGWDYTLNIYPLHYNTTVQ